MHILDLVDVRILFGPLLGLQINVTIVSRFI